MFLLRYRDPFRYGKGRDRTRVDMRSAMEAGRSVHFVRFGPNVR